LQLVVIVFVFLTKLFFEALNLEALLVQLGFSLEQFVLAIFVFLFEKTGQVGRHVLLDGAIAVVCVDILRCFQTAALADQVVCGLAEHIDLEIV